MLSATLLSLTVGLAPLQVAAPSSGAVEAPAPQPAGRAFRLREPVRLRFSVETNVGPIEGTIAVADIVGRGLEGWGRFELVMRLDPSTVNTGDALRDRIIADRVLQASKGPLVVAAWNRTTPPRSLPPDAPPDMVLPKLPAAVGVLDDRRRRRPVELRYAFEGDAQQGTLRIEHSATLDALGLPPAPHPFVQVTGPVRMTLEAPLVRER